MRRKPLKVRLILLNMSCHHIYTFMYNELLRGSIVLGDKNQILILIMCIYCIF